MTASFELKISDQPEKIYQFDDVYQLTDFLGYYYPDAIDQARKDWNILSFDDWYQKTELLIRALSTAALTSQDDIFDQLSEKLDDLNNLYPHYVEQIKQRKEGLNHD